MINPPINRRDFEYKDGRGFNPKTINFGLKPTKNNASVLPSDESEG